MTDKGFVGLLKRKPGTTREQFNHYWLQNHGPAGIPWALALGCDSYIQYHNPVLSKAAKIGNPTPQEDLDIDDYDGAAVLTFNAKPAVKESEERLNEFFVKVIVPDKMQFLAGPAREIARFVDERLVEGAKIVLVENGKVAKGPDGNDVVDVNKAWQTWSEWGFNAAALKE